MKTMYTRLKLLDVLKPLALMVVFLFFGYNAQSQSSNSPVCENSSDILLTCAGGVITTCNDIGVPTYPRYSWICTATGFTSTQKNPTIPIGDPYYLEGTYFLTVWYGPGPNDFENGFTTVVFIDPLTPGVASANQTICPGGSLTNLTSTRFGGGAGYNNVIYTWQKRVPPATIWTNTTQTGSTGFPLYNVLPYNFLLDPIMVTTEFRVRGENSYCPGYAPQYSNIVTITVLAPPLAGTIAASQTICYNTVPADLTGPATGTTYTWEQSISPFSTWTAAIPTNTGTGFNFGTTALTQTTKYRRWTTLSGGCGSVEPSNTVTIFVQGIMEAGSIAASQTICNGTIPANLTSVANGTGSGTITYNWEQSVSPFSTWTAAVPSQHGPGFAFGFTLTQTTEYRRITVSTIGTNVCYSAPTNFVTIIVQSLVTPGSIGTNQTICHGTTPADLTSVTAGTGIGTITYTWEQSVSPFSTWIPAIPTQFGAGFVFGLTTLTQTTYYRRITISTVGGEVACNSAATTPVIITVQDVPTAGIIAASQTICAGNAPSSICGTGATGSGTLSYVWEVYTGAGWTVIPLQTGPCYSPGVLVANTSYRRYTQSTSGIDTCNSDYTNVVTITVTDAPIAGVEGPDTLCQGACATYYATGGTIGDTYEWSVSGTYQSITYFGNTVTICWGACTEGWITVTISRGNCSNTSAPFHVILHAPPSPIIVGPITVIHDTVNTVTYSALPGTPGHLFNWTVYNGTIIGGQGTSSIQVLWDSPCLGCTGQVCVYESDPAFDTCSHGAACMTVYILPNQANVFGYVSYENNYLTGLNNVNLTLRNTVDYSIVGECTSAPNMLSNGESGYFAFHSIPYGNYVLTADSGGTWGGNNATDALIVQMNPGGPLSTPVKTLAADVNGSLIINATDALNIKLRVVGIVDSYNAGDWAFVPTTFTLNSGSPVMNFGSTFHGLCYGDVNGSYIPAGMKSVPLLTATEDGIQTVAVGESFTYDLRSNSIADLGAMTLFMNFDQNLFKIENVKTSLEGLQYKIENGKLALAWSDVTPISVSNDEPVISLTVKAKEQISAPTQIFTISAGSEFANSNAEPLNFNLKMSNVLTGAKTFSLANYPNPFTNTTNIVYTLPEAGQVRLVITDIFGRTLSVLVDAMQEAGNHSVVVNPANVNLSQGVYLYKIEVSGATDTYSKVNKLIFNK